MGEKTSFQDVIDAIGGAFLIVANLATPFRREARSRWGTTESELLRTLPGDELIPTPKWGYTYAVTIQSTVELIWPWLVQMGDGRGGMYSYDLLENLAGCNMHSADRIVPELQNLEVGDSIRIHPSVPPWPVYAEEEGQWLLLYGDPGHDQPETDSNQPTSSYFAATWLLYLQPVGEHATRLITRGRYDYSPDQEKWMGPRFMEPVSFVMQRKMLLGIKGRVRAKARTYSPPGTGYCY